MYSWGGRSHDGTTGDEALRTATLVYPHFKLCTVQLEVRANTYETSSNKATWSASQHAISHFWDHLDIRPANERVCSCKGVGLPSLGCLADRAGGSVRMSGFKTRPYLTILLQPVIEPIILHEGRMATEVALEPSHSTAGPRKIHSTNSSGV